MVVSMDFQRIGTEEFRNEAVFSRVFAKMFSDAVKIFDIEGGDILRGILAPLIADTPVMGLMELFGRLSRICETAPRPVVLIIDEVDSAANNQVFVDFLSMIRGYYLNRENQSIFQSVILAGVYDIKNLKLKLRPEAEHKYNSPWNIAADFKMDMSFSASQICLMLEEYERDHHV